MLRAEPAPGAVATGVVDQVTLVFLEPIQPEPAVVVRDDGGNPVPGLGTPALRDGGTVAEVPFAPLTRAGGYVVEYRYLGLDGHPMRQTHRFTYEPSEFVVQPLPPAPGTLESTTVVGMVAVAGALLWGGTAAVRRNRKGPGGATAK